MVLFSSVSNRPAIFDEDGAGPRWLALRISASGLITFANSSLAISILLCIFYMRNASDVGWVERPPSPEAKPTLPVMNGRHYLRDIITQKSSSLFVYATSSRIVLT